MSALVYRGHGDPREVLEWTDDAPDADPDGVLVEVLAAPVLPMDRLQLWGLYPWPVDLPAVAGAAGCGRVLEGELSGRLVLLPIRSGTWRTRGRWGRESLVPIDGGADPVQASMLVVNGVTAHDLLHGLSAGDTVVQAPGGGAVAQLVDQLCAARGMRCVSMVHRPPLAQLQGEVVSSLPEGLRATRALDGVGGPTTQQLAACTQDGGEVWHYGAMSRQAPSLGVSDAIFRGVSLRGYWLRRHSANRPPGELCRILQTLAGARLTVAVGGTWGLDGYREALAYRGQGVAVLQPVS